MALVDYQKLLYEWIMRFNYKKLGWTADMGVRDTGPFLDQKDYGTHGAVRIFYSPEVIAWLKKDRSYPLPDGAIIIKEMYTPPAAIYQELKGTSAYHTDELYEQMLESVLTSWVVMVKDSQLSSDGWYWASVETQQAGKTIDETINTYEVDTYKNRGGNTSVSQLRWSGAAMPCIRCHASAINEMTFSDLNNVDGSNPLIFRTDDSWRTAEYFANHSYLSAIKDNPYVKRFMNTNNAETGMNTADSDVNTILANLDDHSLRNNVTDTLPDSPDKKANPLFLSTFKGVKQLKKTQVKNFPPEWMDHVVMPASHGKDKNGNTEHITSDNCVGCHGGLSGGINREVMFVANTQELSNADQRANGFNLSEYGEWRWSPMGLAGRDPIFHAQLESEMNLLIRDAKLDKKNKKGQQLLKGPLKATQQAVTDKCLTCHGAMGERQLGIDTPRQEGKLWPDFQMEYFYLKEAVTQKEVDQQKKAGTYQFAKYGALAREGISCMICHHIDNPDPKKVASWDPDNPDWLGKNISDTDRELAYNLFHHSSGEYRYGPSDQVFGPIDEVKTKPMQHSLNLTPMHNSYIQDSQMCGNCHTINLPNIGSTVDEFPVLTAAADPNFPAFKDYNHTIEQATFVEWQNSIFSVKGQNDVDKNPTAFASCQDCHMPNGFKNNDGSIDIDPLITQVASIQDSSYPSVESSLPNDDINVPVRDDYSRHTHVGLNVFLLSMMDQFNDILGLSKSDYMTGVSTGPQLAIDNMIQQAQHQTAELEIGTLAINSNNDGSIQLKAPVTVTNKTGHRYPSGVAFRRAFLEFTVTDSSGKVVWQSGGTNNVGVIMNFDTNKPLTSEFLPNNGTDEPLKEVDYQPHYQVIKKPTQVQIYEELNLNAQDEFTSSFIHRVHPIKDNRLLPRGWKESRFFKPQGQVIQQFMAATDPEGVDDDPDYQSKDDLNFAGTDHLLYDIALDRSTIKSGPLSVSVTLYNQSIPPYWLNHRFTEAPKGIATQRLYYMASHLDLTGTPMENWKLKLVSDEKSVPIYP